MGNDTRKKKRGGKNSQVGKNHWRKKKVAGGTESLYKDWVLQKVKRKYRDQRRGGGGRNVLEKNQL